VNLSNKVGRGKFSHAFFLQCLEAMNIDLPDGQVEHSGPTSNSNAPEKRP